MKNKKLEGAITFGETTYTCEVRDGIRYIDGKTVDEFLATLDPSFLPILAKKGRDVLIQALSGKKIIKN